MNKVILAILLAQLFTTASHAIERSVPLPYDYSNSISRNIYVPPCSSLQYVGVSGTHFVCKNLPSCASGQFLTFNGSGYACGTPTAAATPTPTPTPAATCTNVTQSVIVGGGTCGAYGMGKAEYTYNGKVISDCHGTCGGFTGGQGVFCPSTWAHWGVASFPGACSKGKSTYTAAANSFDCVDQQTVCK